MNNISPLKIMYLSPVAVDSLDGLFEEMVKDTKDPGTRSSYYFFKG